MRIRTKLLILLLVISLTPLFAGGVFVSYSMMGLRRALASGAREAQTDYARELLSRMVVDYGRIIQRDRLAVEQAVKYQAQEVERLLGLPPSEEPRLYFNEDYADPDRTPPDIRPSRVHYRPLPDGGREPIDVSYSEQVYFVVAGIADEAVAADMASLSPMPEIYAFAEKGCPGLPCWQYTSMESGFHSCYPGHGGYPSTYDPRVREWYTRARDNGDLTWLVMPEVSTRTVAQTAAMPVRYPDGNFAGVTAIDVPFSSMFKELNLPEMWAKESQIMLATLDPDGKVKVLVTRDYERHGEAWQMPLEIYLLESDTPGEIQRILGNTAHSDEIVVRMGYRGVDSLWAFGASSPGHPFPVIIVPYDTVVAEAAEAERAVLVQMGKAIGFSALLMVGAAIIASVAAALAAKSISGPVRKLAEAGEKLAEGDYEAKVDIRTKDELRDLGNVFNTMGPRLLEHSNMKQSLELAMQIQQNLLPQAPPVLEGFEIYGGTEYCDQTGGDYYDYVDMTPLGADRLGIVVADVSGHGVPAALLMASARSAFRIHAQAHPDDPAAVVSALNKTLVLDTTDDSFMTIYYILVDTRERLMYWTAAGHDPALLIKRTTGNIEELGSAGLPAGFLEDADYSSSGPQRLESGDIIVIGTDGIWEARDPDDNFYGWERLIEVVKNCEGESAKEVYDYITASVREFCAGRHALDDITLVVMKVS